MDKGQERFIKNILNMVIRTAMQTTMWRLPLWITIALGLAAAGAIWYWKLF